MHNYEVSLLLWSGTFRVAKGSIVNFLSSPFPLPHLLATQFNKVAVGSTVEVTSAWAPGSVWMGIMRSTALRGQGSDPPLGTVPPLTALLTGRVF